TPERVVDRLRRGGKSPLQDREREPNNVAATSFAFALQLVGAVHLPAHVVRDLRVEKRLVGRERVRDRVSATFGEQRLALERQKLLLDHPAHQSLRFDLLRAIAWLALKLVGVDERHEE